MRRPTLATNILLGAASALALALLAVGCSSEPESWEEGELVDGRKHGVWTRYRADGSKETQGRYDYGRQDGVWRTWYPDGTLESEYTYQDGSLEGPHTKWHPNGQKRRQGNFRADKRHGTWYRWDGEGNLLSEQEWESGTLMESYAGGKPDTRFVIRIELRTLERAGLDTKLVLSDLKKLTTLSGAQYREEDDCVVIVVRDRRAGEKLMEHGFPNAEGRYFRLRDLSTMQRVSEDNAFENPTSS